MNEYNPWDMFWEWLRVMKIQSRVQLMWCWSVLRSLYYGSKSFKSRTIQWDILQQSWITLEDCFVVKKTKIYRWISKYKDNRVEAHQQTTVGRWMESVQSLPFLHGSHFVFSSTSIEHGHIIAIPDSRHICSCDNHYYYLYFSHRNERHISCALIDQPC